MTNESNEVTQGYEAKAIYLVRKSGITKFYKENVNSTLFKITLIETSLNLDG